MAGLGRHLFRPLTPSGLETLIFPLAHRGLLAPSPAGSRWDTVCKNAHPAGARAGSWERGPLTWAGRHLLEDPGTLRMEGPEQRRTAVAPPFPQRFAQGDFQGILKRWKYRHSAVAGSVGRQPGRAAPPRLRPCSHWPSASILGQRGASEARG